MTLREQGSADFWAAVRKVGNWEWMMLAAPQIGSRKMLYRHTTGPSCNQWKRLHEVMPPFHVTIHVIGHVTMQAWYMSEFEHWANRVEQRSNALDFLLFFFGWCNSTPLSFFYTAYYWDYPIQASRLINTICSSLVIF